MPILRQTICEVLVSSFSLALDKIHPAKELATGLLVKAVFYIHEPNNAKVANSLTQGLRFIQSPWNLQSARTPRNAPWNSRCALSKSSSPLVKYVSEFTALLIPPRSSPPF